MVRTKERQDEITMLREHQHWLLLTVIPGYRSEATDKVPASIDWLSVDACLEQLFDIAYQLKLIEGLERAEGGERLKEFNANKRREKHQTYEPYESE